MPGNIWQPKGKQPERGAKSLDEETLTNWELAESSGVCSRSGGLAQKKGSLTCLQKAQNSGEHLLFYVFDTGKQKEEKERSRRRLHYENMQWEGME